MVSYFPRSSLNFQGLQLEKKEKKKNTCPVILLCLNYLSFLKIRICLNISLSFKGTTLKDMLIQLTYLFQHSYTSKEVFTEERLYFFIFIFFFSPKLS